MQLGLYQLNRDHIDTLANFLADSFISDPLYCELIPNEEIRQKLLPKFFESYLEMIYDYSYIYADSEEINGIIVVFHEDENHSTRGYLKSVLKSIIKTSISVVKCDHSLKTALHFLKGRVFLSSSWVEKAVNVPLLHVDLIAVKKEYRGKGIATKLMNPILHFADDHKLVTTLETHNSNNVEVYRRYGFKTIQQISNQKAVHQYCMVR